MASVQDPTSSKDDDKSSVTGSFKSAVSVITSEDGESSYYGGLGISSSAVVHHGPDVDKTLTPKVPLTPRLILPHMLLDNMTSADFSARKQNPSMIGSVMSESSANQTGGERSVLISKTYPLLT